MISYSESCRDPNLFGPWFAEESWGTWRVLDKALFGEPLDEAEAPPAYAPPFLPP